MRQTLLEVVSSAKSDVDAINKIQKWNQDNIVYNKAWKDNNFARNISISAGDIFETKKHRLSTTVATLLAAELRAIGIPTMIMNNDLVSLETQNVLIHHP
jgi:hypothetical protein